MTTFARATRLRSADPVLVGVVLAVLAFRLPFLAAQASPDEAGLLIVGGQWDGAGRSLYGDFWVDRPPLLVLTARLAAHAGGLLAWRLLGLLAVVVAVLACAGAARRLAGPVAGRASAVAAAVLLTSPWMGADRVNAELLAAPWIALGLLAAVRAVEDPRSPWPWLAGAAAIAAMATKQNLGDVVVFLAILLIASVSARRLAVRSVAAIALGFTAGAALAVGAVVAAAWRSGTSLPALLDAVYAFRLRAAEVLAAHSTEAAGGRDLELLARAAIAGVLVLALAVVLAPARRDLRSPVTIALAGTVAFGTASAALGGSYWSHYLVQLAVPVAIGTGLLAVRLPRTTTSVLAGAGVSAVVGAVVVLPALTTPDARTATGHAIGEVARPGDTIVNAWGRPDVVRAAGLTSPYPQLWSLPVRTDDPALTAFAAVLDSPEAPTWLVMRGSLKSWGLSTARAQELVDRRYRVVGSTCGIDVWLRRDAERPTPRVRGVACKVAPFLR